METSIPLVSRRDDMSYFQDGWANHIAVRLNSNLTSLSTLTSSQLSLPATLDHFLIVLHC